ncbi:MAG: glycoside hydrolase family 25 [Oscillospiraceae bacterium]|jgi:lysozyme|nr:glycoside hydrolase family 25 [Oscillospiraceae bacterium]
MKKAFLIKTIIIAAAAFVAAVAAIAGLFYFGVLHFNNPSAKVYPVRGVDSSSYQGEINWQTLAKEGIDFAYVKATEGSTYVDSCFEYNLENALKTDLYIGAYHFFSFESSGSAQAAHFIATVPLNDGMLPPVVDLEFYGDYENHAPSKEAVTAELNDMLERLAKHYNKKPLIYVTKESYELYISGGFAEYDIWFRNVTGKPKLNDGREWTLWQYSNRHRLKAYSGSEPYIDFNVFNGNIADFKKVFNLQ